jgi:polysaccharide pyruvyl transferase WcaK-like protein
MFLVNLSALYNRRLIIFNTDEYSDKQVHASLIDLLIKHGFSNFTYVEDTTLEEKLTIISRACCVITARLHTAVAADVFDKPIVVYNYSQKISEFAFGKENVKVISGNLAELTADDIDLKEKTSKEAIAIDEKVYKNFAVQCKE